MSEAPVLCEVAIRAPASTVFAMFTDPAMLGRWIGIRALLEPRPGGSFRFELIPPDPAEAYAAAAGPPPPPS